MSALVTSTASAISYGTTAWGNNEFGELGNGTLTDSHVPVAVEGLTRAAALSRMSRSPWNLVAASR